MAIRQHVRIVDGCDGDLPFEGTIGSDDRQAAGGIIGGEDPAPRFRKVGSLEGNGGGGEQACSQEARQKIGKGSGAHGLEGQGQG